MNILIMGLSTLNNMGEKYIIDCTKFLLKDKCDTVSECDFEPSLGIFRFFPYYGVLTLSKIIKNDALYSKLEYAAVKIRCASKYKKAIKESDGVIFAAGSLKYGTQKLWAYYCLAIEIANKFGKKVMFDAMNVQKHNDSRKCTFLNEHLNYPNVSVITSRDGELGVRRLREEYHLDERIVCEGVGDVAFWIPECYNAKRNPGDTFGVNLIMENIFLKYGGTLTEDELLATYLDILNTLDKEGIKWELFTNGLPKDYQFGLKLIEKYNSDKQIEIFVPKTAEELIEKITGYKCILGARLHACICAYATDTPVLGFCWDEKMTNFSIVSGLKDHFFSEEQIRNNEVSKALPALFESGYEFDTDNRNNLKSKTNEYLTKFIASVDK